MCSSIIQTKERPVDFNKIIIANEGEYYHHPYAIAAVGMNSFQFK